jgi:hypothetical protein
MSTSIWCARCEERREPDDEHHWIQAKRKAVDERTTVDSWMLCPECYRELTEDWIQPA